MSLCSIRRVQEVRADCGPAWPRSHYLFPFILRSFMCQSQMVPLFRQIPAPKKTEQQKNKTKKKTNLVRHKKMPADPNQWGRAPNCAGFGAWKKPFHSSSLGVNGDDFTAAASNQEDSVQALHENLQELHVWVDDSQGDKHNQVHLACATRNGWWPDQKWCNSCIGS